MLATSSIILLGLGCLTSYNPLKLQREIVGKNIFALKL